MSFLSKLFGRDDFNFGIRIVSGTFGAGKTKNTFQKALMWKQDNPDGIVIGNVPYDFLDIHFSSPDDLTKILDYILRYIRDTNDSATLGYLTFRPIYFIIDEAHLYFFSRNFKKFNADGLNILTQCRKREIQIFFLTQTLAQLDILVRRLTPWITEFQHGPLGTTRDVLYYTKVLAANDLGDALSVEEESSRIIRWDKVQAWFNPLLKDYFAQVALSRFVVGLEDRFHMEYSDFLALMVPEDSRDDQRLTEIVDNMSTPSFTHKSLVQDVSFVETKPLSGPLSGL